MILVTGASGKTGRILTQVLSKVESVCAFVHRPEQVAVLRSLGADKVVVGDLHDSAMIHSALAGVRSVYHICPNMSPDEVEVGSLVLEAARQARVTHFVYHSVLHPQTEKMIHHWQKLQVEEMLFESGLPFTILQPAPYMQNLLAGWKNIVREAVLRVPYSVQAKFSFVDLADVAEAARIVMTEAGHQNAVYELAGTGPTTHVEVAEVLSQVLGQEVRAEQETIQEWGEHAGSLNEYTLENLIRMFEYYDRWGLVGNVNVLHWILKREPNSLATFFTDHAKAASHNFQ